MYSCSILHRSQLGRAKGIVVISLEVLDLYGFPSIVSVAKSFV